jgi:hypothetical protein
MVLRELILRARERGISRLVGCYIASGRNDMVKDHYAKLGFAAGDREDVWILDVAVPEPAPTMRISRPHQAEAFRAGALAEASAGLGVVN